MYKIYIECPGRPYLRIESTDSMIRVHVHVCIYILYKQKNHHGIDITCMVLASACLNY